ncbi:MAG: hypothetical protein P4L85_10795 [Paludisphaera borealis]|uniref:hypothetical protein n=1 Tax=Paludisphaera borealis TaxID=1387353 RepID=UPI00283FD26A|nr:hypothetical protein [Paludisphaera borealis]MDR3619826.1 hypothetical protein [Paludisphaera borealis]
MNDSPDDPKPKSTPGSFDFSAFPKNTVFHERRTGRDRRDFMTPPIAPRVEAPRDQTGAKPPERRARKERRKRIDPTTFEKQYTDDELAFMNAMQRFKERTGRPFPSHGEVIKVAVTLGYRKLVDDTSPAVFDQDASLMLFPKMEHDA